MRSQYASVWVQGNTADSVASNQLLIDRTLSELCNVKETHLTKLTLTLLTVEYKSSLLLKQLYCYRNIHMYDFYGDAEHHHKSQCKH